MQNDNSNRRLAFLLTLVFPFGGLIYTLSHWRAAWAKNMFWLACIYMGAVLIYLPEGAILGEGADGGRYVLYLMDMYGSNISIKNIVEKFQVDQHTMDLYQPLMTYLVSRFSDNGHVLFTAFAIVFGFFYSRNIWFVLERLPNQKLGILSILVILYFLVSPITHINGVRMWTALHVFVYGMMPYLLERDRSKLWWVLLAPLIHFSYLYVVFFAVVFVLLPKSSKTNDGVLLYIAFAFFIVSLFVNTLNLDVVAGTLAEYSPEAYEQRIEGYVNQDYADIRADAASRRNWYVAFSGNIIRWVYSLLLIAFLPCLKRNFKKEPAVICLYIFTLFLTGFANIMALIPSGGRFQLLSQMFTLPLLLLVAMNISNRDVFRKMITISAVFLLFPLIFQIRQLFDYFSITLLVGNFITVFFWENNTPLIEYIKQFI